MVDPRDIEVEPRAGPSTNRPGCTFRRVSVRRTKRKSLVALLAKATTPILIEHLAESWPGYDALMAQHGSLAVEAVHNESVTSFFMSYAANTYSLAEYSSLRSGAPSVDATYVFSDERQHGHLGVVARSSTRARASTREIGMSAEDVAAELGGQSVLEVLRDARRQREL